MDFHEMAKIALKAIFEHLELKTQQYCYYTMKFYRKILAIKAQHSSKKFWLMFRAEN